MYCLMATSFSKPSRPQERQIRGELGYVPPSIKNKRKQVKDLIRAKKEEIRKAALEVRQTRAEEKALLAQKRADLESRKIELRDLVQKKHELSRGIDTDLSEA